MSTDDITLDFLKAEVAKGLAFASMAREEPDDHLSRDRHRSTAQHAYDIVSQRLSELSMSSDEAAEMSAGINTLRSALEAVPKR